MSSEIRAPGAAEWGKVQLVSLLSEKPRNGLYKGAEYQGAGSRWVKMKDIYGNDFIRNQQMSLIEVSQSEAERFGCEDGDLLFGRTSLTLEGIGDCALVCEPCDRPIFESNLFRIRFDHVVAVPRFFYYFFKSFQGKELIQSIAKQTAATSITASDLIRLDVPCPDLASQHGICDFLESLDDRITLLRETNATLEAIAQALFKSWFVDFDPVRAKAEGLEPQAMDAPTAALFPDSFEESELGLVPKGWRVGSILDIANLLSGGTPKTDRVDFWGGDVPWASAKDVSQAANSILTGTERTITDLGLQKSSTKMIPAFSTVVVARGATTGRMVMFGKAMAMNQTCYALESKARTPIALYLVLKKEIDALTQKAHGSVFDTITTSTFSASKTLLIPDTLLACFESVAGPLFHGMLAGTQKAETLTQLRDTLLPRLISGQLRLPEAETLLENAL